MINYDRVLEFCIQNNICSEELFLLYTVFIKNEEGNEENLFMKMNTYYALTPSLPNKINYVELVRNLERRDLLRCSIRLVDGVDIKIRNLSITEKGRNFLFCDPEVVWEKFISLYPREGFGPDGSRFKSNLVKEGDKEYFFKHVINRASKFETDRLLYIVGDLFDDGKEYAEIGITRFIRNVTQIIKEYEEGNGIVRRNKGYTGYTSI